MPLSASLKAVSTKVRENSPRPLSEVSMWGNAANALVKVMQVALSVFHVSSRTMMTFVHGN